MTRPIVMKFGGTSVGDSDAFERVCQIVELRSQSPMVIVVSAMSKVTDGLLSAIEDSIYGRNEQASTRVKAVIDKYSEVNRTLIGSPGSFDDLLKSSHIEILRLLNSFRGASDNELLALKDEIVSYGEQLSARLLASVLSEKGFEGRYIDARRCIITDEEFGQARPLKEETIAATNKEILPVLESGAIPVLGGFIGSSLGGKTTTLGRGGSDYSASIVGSALSAAQIEIWTDVDGVLTADPRIIDKAATISRLSYSEAAELAYFGAKVLHPKTIQPAVDLQIPVRICNSRNHNLPGTIVTAEADRTPGAVKAIAHKTGVTVVEISSAGMLGAYGFLRAIFDIFEKHRTVVDVVTTSEVSVSLTIDNSSALPKIVEDLEKFSNVTAKQNRAIVCVVGEGLRDTKGVAADIFSQIRESNVWLISQGASKINLTFVIDEENVREVVGRLHEKFFKN
jgi:aspartate kinase